jgi:hypothetical protein
LLSLRSITVRLPDCTLLLPVEIAHPPQGSILHCLAKTSLWGQVPTTVQGREARQINEAECRLGITPDEDWFVLFLSKERVGLWVAGRAGN